jgi:hypothetical protein
MPSPMPSSGHPGELPVAWCNVNAGQAGTACGFCGAFIGGLARQLGCGGGGGDKGEEEAATCSCELGCGEAYCGARCRDAAAPCHRPLCVGPVGEEHPLYQFRLVAFSSGAIAQFTLAAKLAVMMAIRPAGGRQSALANYWALSASSPLWWELPAPGMDEAEGGDGEDEAGAEAARAQYRADAEEIASAGWALLCEGVPQLLHGAGGGEDGVGGGDGASRSALDWGRLLAYVSAQRVEISRPTLVEVTCRSAWDRGGADSLSACDDTMMR